jgi:hypothetical protein
LQTQADKEKFTLQTNADQEKLRLQTNSSALQSILNPGDPYSIASKLKLFLDTNIIQGQDGKPDQSFRDTQLDLEKRFQQEIFLNIIRASLDEPLEFPSNSSVFYESMLRPIDLTTLGYFIRLGDPHEMLYWLFFGSGDVTIEGAGTYGFLYDPPNDYGCPKSVPGNRCFIDLVRLMVATGLTVEQKTYLKGNAEGKPIFFVYPRFCFSHILAARAQRSMSNEDLELMGGAYAAQGSPRCGDPWDPLTVSQIPQPETFKISIGTLTFRITPRSAYGVFEFFGAVLRAERGHLQPLPSAYIPISRRPPMALPSQDVTGPPMLSTVDPSLDRKLLNIRSGGRDCFAQTRFNGVDYCVPPEATITKRVFQLLGQLISLSTEGH